MRNILFITADQWRADALSAIGRTPVRTPNIDRLIAEGVWFRRHFAGAAPCSPARACLYTGLYQMTNRVVGNGTPLDHRHLTMATAMRRAGYDPTLFGYTDTGMDPRATVPGDPRLRTYEGILSGMTVRVNVPEYPGPWLSFLRRRGHAIPADWREINLPASAAPAFWGRPPRYSAEETQTAFLVEAFTDWMLEQRRPWFAHLSFLTPHPPFVVPEPYCRMYAPGEDPAPHARGTWLDEGGTHPLKAMALDGLQRWKGGDVPPAPHPALTVDETAAVRATYWGMVSELDAQIGRLRAALEAAGQWDTTVLVLTSDHGEQLGDHHLWGKLLWHDASFHIPLIIRRPGDTTGRRVDAFTEAVDILPTLMDLAGLDIPAHLDGASLVPWLEGAAPADWRQAAHFEFDVRAWRSLVPELAATPPDRCGIAIHREARWKYVHCAAFPPLLYDLDADPHEQVNLAEDPAHAAVRLQMAEKLLSWRAEHLDRLLTNTVLA